LNEYVTSLGVDLSFQKIERELSGLESMYAAPLGLLLLAWRGSEAIGCIGVRALSGDDCEMKRLYVRPSARGLGLGRRMAEHAIGWATARGYARMCLDTLASMGTARALYRELGFEDIDPYYDNPLAGTTFMARALAR
jgi:ribosomal protein S18 acetylase RimI-like enzyme